MGGQPHYTSAAAGRGEHRTGSIVDVRKCAGNGGRTSTREASTEHDSNVRGRGHTVPGE